jgi:hypothetical protein
MAQEKSFTEALKEMPQQDILALASKLYALGKAQVAAGTATQDDIAILNNARKQLQNSSTTER